LRLNARDGAAYEANETPQKAFASRDRHSEEEEEEEEEEKRKERGGVGVKKTNE
jgi:hypothetical protein